MPVSSTARSTNRLTVAPRLNDTRLTDEGERDPARLDQVGHPHEGDQDAGEKPRVGLGAHAGRGGRNQEREARVHGLRRDARDHERDHRRGESPSPREEEVDQGARPDEQRRVDHDLAHDEWPEERMVDTRPRRRHRAPGRRRERAQASQEFGPDANRRQADADRHQDQPPPDPGQRRIGLVRRAHRVVPPTAGTSTMSKRAASAPGSAPSPGTSVTESALRTVWPPKAAASSRLASPTTYIWVTSVRKRGCVTWTWMWGGRPPYGTGRMVLNR